MNQAGLDQDLNILQGNANSLVWQITPKTLRVNPDKRISSQAALNLIFKLGL